MGVSKARALPLNEVRPLGRWGRGNQTPLSEVFARAGAVLAGAALLLWPALWNGYPIVFSDTGGLIEMSLEPTMGWDKPWIYGPFVHLFHWRTTLWASVVGQAVLLSWVLFAVAQRFGVRRWHVARCAVLAVGSAAPWFASLLMPDFFTPVVVLCLLLLAMGGSIGWAMLGAVAIAAHLSHLVLAAGCIVTLGVLQWRWPWRPGLALVGAIALLVATNVVGYGRWTLSPNGSVFALARLIGDGPGRWYIDNVCPGAGLKLCAWSGRLATNSDDFLWAPCGPLWDRALWGDAFGPVALAPEASRLVPAIIAAYPGPVLVAAVRNALAQLALVRVGDTLGPDFLDDAVVPKLALYFPAAEVARFRAGRQAQGTLMPPPYALHLVLLGAGLIGTVALLTQARWRPLAGVVLVGLIANAASTGALSAPHDRYQARIAWLVLLPPLLVASCPRRSAGDDDAERADA